MDIKTYSFNARIENFEKVNSQFAKVKVYVLYTGKNRNRSIISKEVVEKALYSLKNIPVVGEWKEENENFGGHGGKIEISDDGIEWIETTKPYGVVPSDTEIKWEKVREKDGLTEHEYLTCTAYLWYQRYPELEKVLNDGSNQSMEINAIQYHMDDEGYTVFDEIEFSALCILGKDSDPSKNVEPCFEGAKITNYTLDKDQFKLEFAEMLKELKESLQNHSSSEVDNKNTEGGIEVENNNSNSEKVEETISTENEKEFNEENKINDDVDIEVIKQGYEKTISDLKLQIETLQSDYSQLKTDFEDYKNNYSTPNEEVEKLRKFKQDKLDEERQIAEEVIFEQFSELTGMTEFEELKKNASKFDLTELEEKCYAILGKKNAKFSNKQTSKKDKVKLDFSRKNDESREEYDDLFEKYLK